MNQFIRPSARLAVIALLFSSLATQAAEAQDAWGNLSGQVIVKGTPPTNAPEDVAGNADRAICLVDGQVPLDDNILVGENGGLKDVLVMMYLARGDEAPTPHPAYDEKKVQSITIDNVKCRFEPHAIFVQPGQTFVLKNSDTVGHNCHITTLNNEHNINLPAGGSVDLVLKESDTSPGEVKCDVHKWMDAVIMVRDNPYVAITDAEGKFNIENVPAGEWKFQLWHKKVGWLSDLDVPGKKLGRRGDFEVEIPDGDTLDLGKLEFPTGSFKD